MTVAPIKSSRPKYGIDAMCDEANDSVKLFVARSAGQHTRRMRESWPDAEYIEISTQPADLDPPGARGSVVMLDKPGFFEWIRRIFRGRS